MISRLLSHRHAIVAISFTLWGMYLRIQRLAGRALWLDELSQIKGTLGPLKPFWLRLTYGERTCFPGEYLLNYPFVQIFDHNKWGLAIPHFVSMILGYVLFYMICRRYLKTILAWTIAYAIYTLNTNLIYHALEFRPYAVLPTMALAAFYLSEKAICRPHELSIPQKWGIGIFYVFCGMYHAYGMLIVGSILLYFLMIRLREVSIRTLFNQTAHFMLPSLVVAIILFLWYATGQSNLSFASAQAAGMNTFDYIPNPLNDLNRFLRAVFGNMTGVKKLKWLINGIILALLIPHNTRWRKAGFFLVLIILPLQLQLLASLEKGYWFLQRHFVWIMPLYAFLIGWCWDVVFLKSGWWLKTRKPASQRIGQS